MKRDMELIRKLILLLEDNPHMTAPSQIHIEGYTRQQIAYHKYLLVDAGLAVGQDVTHLGSVGPDYKLSYLTWAGHDFADACRDQKTWEEATKIVKEKAGSVTFEVLKQLLVSLIKRSVGLA